MAGYTMAVEFRNKSWFDGKHAASTLAFERERGLVNVVVDEPQGSSNSIPSVWEATNDQLALVRLHGRNHTTWNIKDAKAASDRFNYDYNDDELAGLADEIRRVAALVARTHVIFNNNYLYAVTLLSAKDLISMTDFLVTFYVRTPFLNTI